MDGAPQYSKDTNLRLHSNRDQPTECITHLTYGSLLLGLCSHLQVEILRRCAIPLSLFRLASASHELHELCIKFAVNVIEPSRALPIAALPWELRHKVLHFNPEGDNYLRPIQISTDRFVHFCDKA